MLASVKKKLAARGYIHDENGSIIVFVLVVFSAMFLVGGTAVDFAVQPRPCCFGGCGFETNTRA